jgi:very-short-patch-repair endonuclease/polyhydroxyalkanoate synthesis regulator phasin
MFAPTLKLIPLFKVEEEARVNSTDTVDERVDGTLLDRTARFLDFLSAVSAEVGPKPIRDLAEFTDRIASENVNIIHPCLRVGPSSTDGAWLRLQRVARPKPPTVPLPLGSWKDLSYAIGWSSSNTPAGSTPSPAPLVIRSERLSKDGLRHVPSLDPAALRIRVLRLVEAAGSARAVKLRVSEVCGVSDSDLTIEAPSADLSAEEYDQLLLATPFARHLETALKDRYAKWGKDVWEPWAIEARIIEQVRSLYDRLYAMALKAERERSLLQPVWGNAVILARSKGEFVRMPMIVTPVTMRLAEDGTIIVEPDQPSSIDLEPLQGIGFPNLKALTETAKRCMDDGLDVWDEQQRLALRTALITPFGGEAALDERLPDIERQARSRRLRSFTRSDESPVLDDSWLLHLRPRPQREKRFYRELAQKLRRDGALPEALASMIADRDTVDAAVQGSGRSLVADDGTSERLLMPLPTNDEQERIARQLAHSRGVTVQGPPGTGKSHTIVNLISHLVAQGKRVLVTAEKDQALKVLRDKIPEQLKDLSLAVVGSTPSAIEELRSSAQQMQDSIAALIPEHEKARITELEEHVDSLREQIAALDKRLVEALSSEGRLFTGFQNGPVYASDLAQWIASQRHLDVIEDRIATDTPFPLSDDEYTRLLDVLQQVNDDDVSSCLLDLPRRDEMLTATELQAKWERLDDLKSRSHQIEEGGLNMSGVDRLSEAQLEDLIRRIRETADLVEGVTDDWEVKLTQQLKSRAPIVAWFLQQNFTIDQCAQEALRLSTPFVGHEVIIPVGDPNTTQEIMAEWHQRLQHGQGLPRLGHRSLRDFSAAVRVDGFPVTTAQQLQLVWARFQFDNAAAHLQRLVVQVYGRLNVPVPDPGQGFVFAVRDRAARINLLASLVNKQLPELEEHVTPLMTFPLIENETTWLRRAQMLLMGVSIHQSAKKLAEELNRLTSALDHHRLAPKASPLWGLLLHAVTQRDASEWHRTLEEAERLRLLQPLVSQRGELLDRLAGAGARAWAAQLVQTHQGPGKEQIRECWAYAQARTWLEQIHVAEDVSVLMHQSHEVSGRFRETILELASRSARLRLWEHQKDSTRMALHRWLTALKKIGKGTGKNAPRYRAQAAADLPEAMGAVPVWIMPIYRVMENFHPQFSDPFDVVIVDESSQCDLLSVGVLALGNKSVVVGDDKQTSPQGAFRDTERIAQLQEQYIRDLPGSRLFSLNTSLYTFSEQAFDSTILLREHFRCVPPIIEFSNRFYAGQILPLREQKHPEIGSPLRAIRVEEAASVKVKGGRVNKTEALAIAHQINECAKNPAYEGLTFGVVSMMSGPQTSILQDAILSVVGGEEQVKRKLRVGNPPDFQGDERDVIFLSMVASDGSAHYTTEMNQQWVNVAASRARDQLWVFYSMDPSTLNHNDYRRALIEYVRDYRSAGPGDPELAKTESKFEADVYRQILAHGFDVEPQHQVGRYRIDFVVTAAPGQRLAVECDGDRFHGPEQWTADVRRQRTLERLGWTFWRIRASEYYLDPAHALDPLWRLLIEMGGHVQHRNGLGGEILATAENAQ